MKMQLKKAAVTIYLFLFAGINFGFTGPFSCEFRPVGYYVDNESCYIYHACGPDGEMYSFACPQGEFFNADYLVCDWEFNVDCGAQGSSYGPPAANRNYVIENSANYTSIIYGSNYQMREMVGRFGYKAPSSIDPGKTYAINYCGASLPGDQCFSGYNSMVEN